MKKAIAILSIIYFILEIAIDLLDLINRLF